MDITTAILCDFAQVRDRLLFIASGAVTRIYRPELPADLGIMLGMVVEVPRADAGSPHQVLVRVVNRHGAELASIRSTIQVGDQGLFPNEVQQVPMALNLGRVPIRTWGTHQVRILIDGEQVRALTAYVVPSGGVVTSQPPAERPSAVPEAPVPPPPTATATEDPTEPEADTEAEAPVAELAPVDDGAPDQSAPEAASGDDAFAPQADDDAAPFPVSDSLDDATPTGDQTDADAESAEGDELPEGADQLAPATDDLAGDGGDGDSDTGSVIPDPEPLEEGAPPDAEPAAGDGGDDDGQQGRRSWLRRR